MNRRTFRVATAIMIAAIATHARPAQTETTRRRSDVEHVADLSFARYGDRTLQLDLFRPTDREKPLPAIICIHGGGWFKGDRSSMLPVAQGLAARIRGCDHQLSAFGRAEVSRGDRGLQGGGSLAPRHADDYGVDHQAIGAIGLSAGGHLAALLATSGGVSTLEGGGGHPDQSSRIQAAVAMGAQTDLTSARIGDLSRRRRRSVLSDLPGRLDRRRAASLRARVTPGSSRSGRPATALHQGRA